MSAWDGESDRLALLELWMTNTLVRRRAQEAAWRRLDGEAWTTLTPRARERALTLAYRPMIEALLDQAWPEWRSVAERLAAAGLQPTPDGWRSLQESERITNAPVLPPQVLHRKTAAALVGPDSKAGWTSARRAATSHLTLTNDGILRLRPSRGSQMALGEHVVDADAVGAVLGEIAIPERAVRRGLRLTGVLPRVLLTVENVGPFVDVSVPDDWTIAHVPGWNIPPIAAFIKILPPNTIWCHWGDLDPQGVRILRSLRSIRSDLRWVCPPWWSDVSPWQRPADWSDCLIHDDDPLLLRRLIMEGAWLEQEPMCIDKRLFAAICEAGK